MNLDKKIDGFIQLGAFLDQLGPNGIKNPSLNELNNLFYEHFQDLIKTQYQYNGWFTEDNVRNAISSISSMLEKEAITKWIDLYQNELKDKKKPKKVAVIMAGNIPMVGFHDFFCVLMSG